MSTQRRFDAKTKARFLAACTRLGSIQRACLHVKFQESTVRRHMNKYPRWRAMVAKALAAGLQSKEENYLQFNQEAKKRFLEVFARRASRFIAAEVVGVKWGTIKKHLKKDPEFSDQFDEILGRFCDSLEEEAVRRAMEGVKEPVYQGGHLVGHKQRYSDDLMKILLKRHRKEEFSEKSSVDVNHTGGVLITPGRAKTDAEWEDEHRKGGSSEEEK